MILYLVRHAHAVWSPDENRPLSLKGKKDAERVGEILSTRPIDTIVCSPYLRAWQTIEPLASRLDFEIVSENRLRERTLGCWPGPSFEDAVKDTWSNFNFSYPQGETNEAAQSRAIAVIRELKTGKGNGKYVIGTHGNLLTLIINHFDPSIGFEFWENLSMPDVYELFIDFRHHVHLKRLWVP